MSWPAEATARYKREARALAKGGWFYRCKTGNKPAGYVHRDYPDRVTREEALLKISKELGL